MEQKDEPIKFHRPPNNDEFKQSKKEKDMMAYTVLFQCPNSTAYAFFNPEVCDKNGKLNKAGQSLCRQFFSHPNNIAYMDALKAHLSAVTKGMTVSSGSVDLSDERIDKAFRAFLEQAITDIENGKEIDNDMFKILMELFKKLGRFKDDVEQETRPLRFLPERCFSSCRYRLFVENAVKGGAVLDECQFCKALAYANENGYKDDSTKRLDIPKEVLDAEPENTVKTLDILSGKIDN